MHLYIIGTLCDMRRQVRIYIPVPDGIYREAHCQQSVRVTAKDFTVGKIPPASHDLAHKSAQYRNIRKRPEVLLFYPAPYAGGKRSRYHPAVYSKASAPDIQYAEQVILIIIP